MTLTGIKTFRSLQTLQRLQTCAQLFRIMHEALRFIT